MKILAKCSEKTVVQQNNQLPTDAGQAYVGTMEDEFWEQVISLDA